MANYAFGTSRRLDNTSFRNYATSPAYSTIVRNTFDANPTEAYQWWLSSLGPSNVDDNMLRQLYSRMYSRYMSRQIADPSGSMYPEELSFVDYLSRQDPSYEIARYSPQARQATTREFRRPARWIPS